MRAPVVRRLTLGAGAGGAAGVIIALVAHWWSLHYATFRIGVFSYSPIDDTFSARATLAAGWWDLLWPAALVGLGVGLLTVAGLTAAPVLGSRWHVIPSLGVVGALLAAAVAGVLYARAGTDDDVVYSGHYVGQPRRYVDYLPPYSSRLEVTIETRPDNGWALVGVCVAAGVVLGLVVGTITALLRRRRMTDDAGGAP